MSETVRLEVIDGVALVTLAAPHRRNALDLQMCGDIAATFDDLEATSVVGAVVVTGEPPAFCGGADLSHLATVEPGELRAIYEGFTRVGRCPLPTVAAVNGAAVGAGMNLAMVCDVRLAGRSARFESRFLELGVHPGGGHTWMLRQSVGVQATFATAVFAEVLTGDEAERIGLVWRCLPDDRLLEASLALAARAATSPPELVTRVKSTIDDMARVGSYEEAVDRELVPQKWSVQQPAFRERLAALRTKVRGG